MVSIKVLKIKENSIEMAGTIPRIRNEKKKRCFIINEKGEEISLSLFRMPYRDNLNEDGSVYSKGYGFRVSVPMYDGAQYRFAVEKNSGKGKDKTTEQTMQEFKFGIHSRLQGLDGSFVDTGEYIIRCIDNEIRVAKAGMLLRHSCNKKFNKLLEESGKSYLIPDRKKAAADRKKSDKPVVIIADRVNMGRDNGEALFKYLMGNGYDRDYDLYFAVRRNTPDYERISKIGKVLDFGSEEYKEKFLAADKIITSGFDRWFTDIYGEDLPYMADLYDFDHYFLQHGVIMNDWSKILNYTNRGFSLFCTTADGEYESILHGDYGYTEDEVKLTGLPRYDLLEDEAENLIAFFPTWRVELAGPVDNENGSRLYSDLIKGSRFHEFYNSLINNERLLDAMRAHGFRGAFYLHPSFIANERDFSGNDTIAVHRDADYNRIFRKAAIMVTDYSSVNIDFAYLNKPLVYSQFDRDTFFDYHDCSNGYFDYARDGFGPVRETVSGVVDELLSLMESGCRMSPEYADRADRFFHYRDRNNCRRVAEAIFGKRSE